jgi:hypothetical protein
MFYAVATLLGKETWQGILNQIPETRDLILSHRPDNEFIHFSWIVSNGINFENVSNSIKRIAESRNKFETSYGGIGIFPGEKPVATFILVRNEMLNMLQSEIWQACEGQMGNVNKHYSPNAWVPHVTLLNQNITDDEYCQFLTTSIHNEIEFKVKIDNIAIIFKDGNKSGILKRFNFIKKEHVS